MEKKEKDYLTVTGLHNWRSLGKYESRTKKNLKLSHF
jgi:hypothetical protein